jgi:hypothetical protein
MKYYNLGEPMKKSFFKFVIILIVVSFSQQGYTTTPSISIKEKVKGLKAYPGFINFYWDKNSGKIWLEIDDSNTEFLYVSFLAHGIGSNDIGLDRGQIGNTKIVKFERHGPKLLLIQPNYDYRASSGNPSERHAVTESFAQSVIWGFEVAAEEGSRVLVDATDFFLRDAHDIITVLKRTEQGTYQLENRRSVIFLDQTKNFPLNTEVEAILTFTGDSPGNYVRQVVPTPQAITVYQHHSFIKLPEDLYETRKFDPRAGYFPGSYFDYGTPIELPVEKRYIFRHRLIKKNPDAQISEPVKPIIYYVDHAAPEPIRSALIEGASWWSEAYESAGFRNAFRVELLPSEADPLDIRYNVIQWVHRATRGWSYGSVIADPRTGEIIKGHVSLGSLRVRQDFLIARGLLAANGGDSNVTLKAKEMALARIRQLSAHEVGHTMGLTHNFAASASDRASVMDYPHPLVKLDQNGEIDLSDAYDNEIGEWDKVAIKYGYQQFPTNVNMDTALTEIIQDHLSTGLIFISDDDARSAGGAHPLAHLWDNNSDPVAELKRIMKIRSIVLENISTGQVLDNEPIATVEELLVPMYLFHRYQSEAVAKLVGGQYYTYAVKGDGQKIVEILPADVQWEAFEELLQTLNSKTLRIPENILALLPPRPLGYPRTRELFKSRTGVAFDPLTAAESAANLEISLILHPERAARLVDFHSRVSRYPGLDDVLDRLIRYTWKSPETDSYDREIQRTVANVVLNQMMKLANSETGSNQVRAIVFLKLEELREWLAGQVPREKDKLQKAHYSWAIWQIEQFKENPGKFKFLKAMDLPDGPPIGSDPSDNLPFQCSWN